MSGLDEIHRGQRRRKGLRVTKLNASSPGAVHDAVQTVSNGEDRALGKLFTDGVLDQVVCLQVDSCRGLIQDQYPGFPQQGPGQTHELPLSHTAREEIRSGRVGEMEIINYGGLKPWHLLAKMLYSK